jgi:transposase
MESYRVDGKVKHRIISNLSKWPQTLIDQLDDFLKGKSVTDLNELNFSQGKSCGGLIVVKEVAKRLGILKALGNSHQAKLALTQIAGRIFTQSSRLHISQVWSKDHALNEIFGVPGFDETDLYENLDWLAQNQASIEKKLFNSRHKTGTLPEIYLYDVTSSYLEGEQNELARYGYNRDNKKGKKQIVIGLLCDGGGYPVCVEVFEGNTNDTKTVKNQLEKLKRLYGIERLIFVGDKGMLGKTQIEQITSQEYKWNYITSISKAQINKLLKEGVFQMSLFDDKIAEIEHEGIRYILRRNPIREQEMENNRKSKIAKVKGKIDEKNKYLKEHKKAKEEVALKNLNQYIQKLKLSKILSLKLSGRIISIEQNEEAMDEAKKLDGCYVIKTDAPREIIGKDKVHKKYKDLSKVEFAFRTIKTTIEEIRPIFVRKEQRTRGHVLICMLAYMIIKYITDKLFDLEISRKSIFETLDSIQYSNYKFKSGTIKILPSKFHEHQTEIFERLNIKMPKYL